MAGAGHRGEVFGVWGRRWVLRERLGALDLTRCLANSHEDCAPSRKMHTQTSLEIEFRLWAQRSPKCFRRHLRNPRSSTCSVERGFADFAGMSSRHTRGLAEFNDCSVHLGAWVVALLWFCFCAFAVVVVVAAAAAVHGLSICLVLPACGMGIANQHILLGFTVCSPGNVLVGVWGLPTATVFPVFGLLVYWVLRIFLRIGCAPAIFFFKLGLCILACHPQFSVSIWSLPSWGLGS